MLANISTTYSPSSELIKLNTLRVCQKCKLYKNQLPFLEQYTGEVCDIFWVGLSAKKRDKNNSYPLDVKTSSGKLLFEIEQALPEYKFYRTNLVKCLPLDMNGKLRYPTKKEMNICFENLLIEIETLKPKTVVLLGEKVKGIFLSKNFEENIFQVIAVKHPSYIQIYKKREIEAYKNNIVFLVKKANS